MLDVDDYRAALGFLERLYARDRADGFPEFVVGELGRLIGADQVTWNDMALTVPWSRVVADPPLDPRERAWADATFAAHMLDHPCLRHWLDTGSTAAVAISDLVGERAYRATPLYEELYRHLGYEDQLAINLTPPAGHTLGLAFGRAARGVSARDRSMLELVAPHVRQAYRNIEALARTRRHLESCRAGLEAAGMALVEVDRSGQVNACPDTAANLLARYFAKRRSAGTRDLPPVVRAWLRKVEAQRAAAVAACPLVRRRGACQLSVRAVPAEDRTLLLLEERMRRNTRGLEALRLTRRETDVLLELETGRSNAEIAAVLAISPGTVRKHLDNLYAKLGVRNRTEAVARLRETGSA